MSPLQSIHTTEDKSQYTGSKYPTSPIVASFSPHTNRILQQPKAIHIDDMEAFPISVQLQGYLINDYWSAKPEVHDWAVEQTVFEINVQIAIWVHLDVHGQGIESDTAIMAAFARLRSLGKRMSVPEVFWDLHGYTGLVEFGHAIFRYCTITS